MLAVAPCLYELKFREYTFHGQNIVSEKSQTPNVSFSNSGLNRMYRHVLLTSHRLQIQLYLRQIKLIV